MLYTNLYAKNEPAADCFYHTKRCLVLRTGFMMTNAYVTDGFDTMVRALFPTGLQTAMPPHTNTQTHTNLERERQAQDTFECPQKITAENLKSLSKFTFFPAASTDLKSGKRGAV